MLEQVAASTVGEELLKSLRDILRALLRVQEQATCHRLEDGHVLAMLALAWIFLQPTCCIQFKNIQDDRVEQHVLNPGWRKIQDDWLCWATCVRQNPIWLIVLSSMNLIQGEQNPGWVIVLSSMCLIQGEQNPGWLIVLSSMCWIQDEKNPGCFCWAIKHNLEIT